MLLSPTTTTAFVDGQPIEYRLSGGHGPGPAVVILHGAHMSASCRFAESRLFPAGTRVLVPSRPGYGRTAVSAGPSAPEFAARLAGLCRRLEITSVVIVGISMGARTALTLAAHQPRLVERVVLFCPVSFQPWPNPRWLAHAMFNPVAQRGLWAALHSLLRSRPDVILPTLVRGLTTLKTEQALGRMGGDLDELVAFLATCRSDRGFVTDLRPPTDVTADVAQPTLILASGTDGSVDASHPESLLRSLPDARLVDVDAATHLLWLGDRAGTLAREVRAWL